MNQTPAAILVLAAAAMSFAAHSASMSSHHQTSVILTLCALATGIWGAISLISACARERELLLDGHARLDLIDRAGLREPLRTLKEVARPLTRESRRSVEISAEMQARLNTVARVEGRDRGDILDEILRQHLPKYDQSRAA